jgi:hypothetical protein
MRFIKNFFYWIDQGANLLGGNIWNWFYGHEPTWFGYRDETLSSAMGKAMRYHVKHNQPAKHHYFIVACIWFLEKVDPGHISRSIEDDEGRQV